MAGCDVDDGDGSRGGNMASSFMRPVPNTERHDGTTAGDEGHALFILKIYDASGETP